MAHVYHWKHGWIPLDHAAALSKAHGSHAGAQKFLDAVHGHDAGIRTHRDVAAAIKDLPNVPDGAERRAAKLHVVDEAIRVNAEHLLPPSLKRDAEARHTQARISRGADVAFGTVHINPSSADIQNAADKWKRDHPGQKLVGHEHEVDRIAQDIARNKYVDHNQQGNTDAEAAAQRQRVKDTVASTDARRTAMAQQLLAQKTGKSSSDDAAHSARVQKELAEVDSIAQDVVNAYHGLIPNNELPDLVMEVIDGSPGHKAATRGQYLAAAKTAINKAVATKQGHRASGTQSDNLAAQAAQIPVGKILEHRK